jgi:hypothetical protein
MNDDKNNKTYYGYEIEEINKILQKQYIEKDPKKRAQAAAKIMGLTNIQGMILKESEQTKGKNPKSASIKEHQHKPKGRGGLGI